MFVVCCWFPVSTRLVPGTTFTPQESLKGEARRQEGKTEWPMPYCRLPTRGTSFIAAVVSEEALKITHRRPQTAIHTYVHSCMLHVDEPHDSLNDKHEQSKAGHPHRQPFYAPARPNCLVHCKYRNTLLWGAMAVLINAYPLEHALC